MPAERPAVVQLLREFSIPLLGGVIVAIVWANVAPASYELLLHGSPFGPGSELNFHFVVNELFMALFFGIAAKEITESCLPGGALHPLKKAVNPLLGTLGGVLGPICVYFAWVGITGDDAIRHGWGVPTATDIALAWLVARACFGAKHAAVSFLLLLAVADDGIGLAIIAIFYPDPGHPVQPLFLLLVAAAMAGAFLFRRMKVKSYWAYLLGPGVLSWIGLHFAHLHPALALVPIVPFMPSAAHDLGLFEVPEQRAEQADTLLRFEQDFKVVVDFGLFAFGLANAGVAFSSVGNATWAVMLGLLVGKTFGVFSFSTIAQLIGFPLPDGMTRKSLLVAGMVAALGLTVALFVADVAFADPTLKGAAKMGALLSAVAAPIAFAVSRLLGVHRPAARGSAPAGPAVEASGGLAGSREGPGAGPGASS